MRVAPFSKPADGAPRTRVTDKPAVVRALRPFAGPPTRSAVNEEGAVLATLALVPASAPDLTPMDVVEHHIEEMPAWARDAEARLDLSLAADPLPEPETHEPVVVLEPAARSEELTDAERIARRLEALASRVRSGEIGVVGVDGDAPDGLLVATFLAAFLRANP